jgi:hypothetical protein
MAIAFKASCRASSRAGGRCRARTAPQGPHGVAHGGSFRLDHSARIQCGRRSTERAVAAFAASGAPRCTGGRSASELVASGDQSRLGGEQIAVERCRPNVVHLRNGDRGDLKRWILRAMIWSMRRSTPRPTPLRSGIWPSVASPDWYDAAQSDTRCRSDERPSKRDGCCRASQRLASSRKHGARK